MDNQTIAQQKERLRQVICPDAPELTTRDILDFANKIEFSDYYFIVNLIEVCENYALLSLSTASLIHKQKPELSIDWFLQGNDSPDDTLQQKLSGAWRLNQVDAPSKDDCDKRIGMGWGPLDLHFDNGTIHIYKLNQQQTCPYICLPLYKQVKIGQGDYYKILELTDTQLSLSIKHDYLYYRSDFIRIPESEIRDKLAKEISYINLNGRWIVDEQQEQVSGGMWKRISSRPQKSGLWVCDVYDGKVNESEFGQRPDEHQFLRDTVAQIIWLKYKTPQSFLQLIADGEKAFWGYFIENEVGDYRQSTKRLHFVRWDKDEDRGKLCECLYYIERNITYQKATDKIPVEYLQLWHSKNPQAIAKLISDNSLLEHPAKYQSSDYIGAYIFLHNYLILKKTAARKVKSTSAAFIDAVTAYLQFNEILGLWLLLYEKGIITKYIYLFDTRKYVDFLAKLHEKTEQI